MLNFYILFGRVGNADLTCLTCQLQSDSYLFNQLISDGIVNAEFYIVFDRNGNVDLTYLTYGLASRNQTN